MQTAHINMETGAAMSFEANEIIHLSGTRKVKFYSVGGSWIWDECEKGDSSWD